MDLLESDGPMAVHALIEPVRRATPLKRNINETNEIIATDLFKNREAWEQSFCLAICRAIRFS